MYIFLLSISFHWVWGKIMKEKGGRGKGKRGREKREEGKEQGKGEGKRGRGIG